MKKLLTFATSLIMALFLSYSVATAAEINTKYVPAVALSLSVAGALVSAGMKHVRGVSFAYVIGYDSFGNPMYGDQYGNRVPPPNSGSSPLQAAGPSTYGVPSSLPVDPACSKYAGNYIPPDVITLIATPGAGVAAGFRSADRILETRQNADYAVEFAIAELPNAVAATVGDDMDITQGALTTESLGSAALRRLLLTRAIEIYRMEFTSSVKLGRSSITISFIKGNIKSSTQDDITLQVDNAGQQIELYQINTSYIWTGNKQIISPAANSLAAAALQLKLYVRQFRSYADPVTF